MNLVAEYENGTRVEHRVLLDNLSNGVDFSSLVNDDNMFVDYINYKGDLSNVKCISFSGPGLKYYQDNIKLMYYIPQKKFESKLYRIPSYQLYAEAVEIENFDMYSESIEGHYGIEKEEKYTDYFRISGWAFVNKKSFSSEVYIECGGVFYKTRRIKRDDVQNVFLSNTPWVGFEVLLDKEVKDYRIYIVDTNSLTFFKIDC